MVFNATFKCNGRMCDQVVKGKSISLEKKSVRISDCRNLNQKDVWLVCKEPYFQIRLNAKSQTV
jgi:hypothetical protein